MNEENLRNRIKLVLSENGYSVLRLASGQSSLQSKLNRQINQGTAIPSETIMLVLATFPDVSAEWLMRGTGSMHQGEATEVIENNYKSPHHNSNGSGVQNIGSDQAEVIKAKDLMIEELKRDKDELRKDKDYLMEVIRNLQKQ